MKALIFDVFGTCVDWRTSIAREVSIAIPSIDAIAFADAWRGEYQPAMERIRSGGRGYLPLDVLHRENLDVVLRRFNVVCDDPDRLNKASMDWGSSAGQTSSTSRLRSSSAIGSTMTVAKG